MPQLQFHLFGEFRASRGREPIPAEAWGRQATRLLLALLATRPDHLFPRDELIEALWPHAEGPSAERSLRVTVSLLRRILEPDLRHGTESQYVVRRGRGYGFGPEADCWVDAWTCERQLALADAARDAGRLAEAVTAYEAALDASRGIYLEDAGSAEWVTAPRRYWQERRVAACSALADCRARRGAYAAALDACAEGLALDAYREDLHRQRMLYHYAAGRQSAALTAYRDYQALVAAELGGGPAAELERLRAQIEARHVPGVDERRRYPRLERPMRMPYSLGRTPFVGRAGELRVLLQRAADAKRGRGGAVVIGGEAGAGKTRLVEEFLGIARARHVRTFVGRSYERELGPALEPVLAALAGPLSDQGITTDDVRPDPAHVLALRTSDRREITRSYETISATLVRAARAAGAKAAVLFVDDLQWADAATLDFLFYVALRVVHEPVLLIGAYRREDVPLLGPWLDRLAERRAASPLDVGRLSREESEGLLARLCAPGFTGLEALADFVQRRSEGNAFYLVEYVRSMIEAGIVETDARGRIVRLHAERLPDGVTPGGVRSLLQARLRTLGRSGRGLLQAAAVVGRDFDLPLLCRAVEREATEVWADLEPLLDRGLITEEADDRFHFAHDQLRQTAYADVRGPRRRALHLAVAEALEEGAHTDPAELGHHYLRARSWPRAVDALEEAGRRAEAGFAWEAALVAYTQALEVARREPELRNRAFPLLAAREQMLENLGRHADRVEAVRAMRELAEADGNATHLGEARLRGIGVAEDPTAEAAAAIAAFRRDGDEAAVARTYRALSHALWLRGDLRGAKGASLRALRVHRALGNRRGQAGDSANLAQVHLSLRSFGKVIRWAEAARRLYGSLGEDAGQAMCSWWIATAHRERGDLEEALRMNLEVLRMHDEAGMKHFVGHHHATCATLYLALGRTAEALRHFGEAQRFSRARGSVADEGEAWVGIGLAREQLGRVDEAESAYRAAAERFAVARRTSGTHADLLAEADAWTMLARLLHRLGERDEDAGRAYASAAELVREAGDVGRRAKLRVGMAGLAWRRGDLDEARAAYEEVVASSYGVREAAQRAAALAGLSVVYRELVRLEDSVRTGRRALRALRSLHDRQAEALVLGGVAESYQRLGREACAAAYLRRSLRLRQELGDVAGAAAMQRELARIETRGEDLRSGGPGLVEGRTSGRDPRREKPGRG